MKLYADTSGLATIVLNEPGAEEIRQAIDASSEVASAAIGYAELRAAVARALRLGRVADEQREMYREAVERLWSMVEEVPVEGDLIHRAGDLADLFALRGYDAVHLAALQAVASPGEALFACFDRALRRAAGGLGYDLLPVSSP